MKLQGIAGIIFLAGILTIGILLHCAHANGVYVVNWTTIEETYAAAGNDVRLNITTPPGYYAGWGSVFAHADGNTVRDLGAIWVRVESSGWAGSYETQERYARVDGSENRQAAASGFI